MERMAGTLDSLERLRVAALAVKHVLGDTPPTLAAERCTRLFLHCDDVYREGFTVTLHLDHDGDWMDPDGLLETAYLLQCAAIAMSSELVEHASMEMERLVPPSPAPEAVAALQVVAHADSDCVATLRDLVAEFEEQAVGLVVIHVQTGGQPPG